MKLEVNIGTEADLVILLTWRILRSSCVEVLEKAVQGPVPLVRSDGGV